jgi:hypothetical protein
MEAILEQKSSYNFIDHVNISTLNLYLSLMVLNQDLL